MKINNPILLSKCCKAKVMAHISEEGTGFYQCTKCKKACDIYAKVTQPMQSYAQDAICTQHGREGCSHPFVRPTNQQAPITSTPEQTSDAQEKQECSNCKETIKNCACMRNKCIKCGKSIGNITFTKCDDCFSLSETTEWEKQFHDEIWNKFDLGLEFRTVVKETIEAFIASVVDKEVEKALQKDRIGIFTRIAGSGMAKGRGDELAELISPRYLKHKE